MDHLKRKEEGRLECSTSDGVSRRRRDWSVTHEKGRKTYDAVSRGALGRGEVWAKGR